MEPRIQKQVNKKGISSTLYDPRKASHKQVDWEKLDNFQESSKEKHPNIGLACSIPPRDVSQHEQVHTSYGTFVFESTLSFHLNPVDSCTEILTNIEPMPDLKTTEHQPLTMTVYDKDHPYTPSDWIVTPQEEQFFNTIRLSLENARVLEKDTTTQSECDLWVSSRKNRITSSNEHKVLIRKGNFQTPSDSLLNLKQMSEHSQIA